MSDLQNWAIRRPDGRIRRLPLAAIVLIGLVLPIMVFIYGGGLI